MINFRFLKFCLLIIPIGFLKAAEEKKNDPVEDLAKKARGSIVVISSSDREGVRSGTGTGFVVREDGIIATNFHVIGQHRGFSIRFPDGKTYEPTAILATDRKRDLALIKIDAKQLTPLKLGDSDTLKPGQGILAIGNPLGLDFSVSRGVVAAERDIDGVDMIQIAMPIEPGSSGSPVLDMEGNVRGVIAIKSSAAMGFAVPVNHIKPMLENPIPTPMKQWLTIGALDPDEWKVHLGGHWRQRAGRLIAAGRGSGFGGRTLCISRREAPEDKFACEVEVKLEDESGAAGLAFYHDGEYNHYGFYPTNGSIRLTRFSGPDVFSWSILNTVETDAYKPGEWNRIRVDYNKGKIYCHVNGKTVIEFKDTRLKPGKFGLVKFRDPSAEFRNFRFGDDLTEASVPRKLSAKVNRMVENIDHRALPVYNSKIYEELIAAGTHVPDILNQRAKRLREESKQLENLASQIHERLVILDLVASLNPPESEAINLLEAALHLSRLDNPHLVSKPYVERLERMASAIRESLPENAKPKAKLDALIQYLFDKQGFHGSGLDYYHRSNSYINEVLDDREGLPITLSIVFIEVARRLELPVHGLGIPRRFIAAYQPPVSGEKKEIGEPVLIDVFNSGKIITRKEAEKFAGKKIEDSQIQPAQGKDIIIRMLHNLLSVAEMEDDRVSMIRYLDAILAIDENAIYNRAMRAMVLYSQKRNTEAIRDLEWLVSKEPEDINMTPINDLLNRLYQEKENR
ncbi:MAG: DUF1080 domain-containing protein [Opitutae bacterium]|nr:DUF1080 domain-containing protein [Opitutae bacterium]